ncbi:MAG: glycosyltransferase family 4 protein [Bacteroidota bacterium]|nr:glycosyltransferase family 4 protein [Bacteroidota bacterium]
MNKRVKILMVLEGSFPPDERVEKEAISLINYGFDVHIACYSFQERGRTSKNHMGIKVHTKFINSFTYKASIGCLNFPFYFSFWKKFIWKLQDEEGFKAIHIHDLQLGRIGWKFKKYFKLPFILDLHENFPALLDASLHIQKFPGKLFYSSQQWNTYEKESISNCDHVLTVVEEMRDRIINIGIPENKIIVVPNTPEISQLKTFSGQPDKEFITLFYSGGLTIHRGLQVVIEALPFLTEKYPKLRLWIVGAGSFLKILKQQVKQLELEGMVFFLGFKSQDQMFELLTKSDIALIPHLKSIQTDNSSPNKLYQYLYYNKPIVCSDCNSLKRILGESDSGFIYKSDSPEDFIEQLSKILQAGDISILGNDGRKLILDRYNWDRTVQPLTHVYQNLFKS